MKTYTNSLTLRIIVLLFTFLSLIEFAQAQVHQAKLNSINCNTLDCILEAMINAVPGDEIIIASGTYVAPDKFNNQGKASRFASSNDGTSSNPIILRGENPANPPILKGPDGIYDGYALHILGDYWQVKDIIFEEGSKGIVFDNANYGVIENVTVRELGEEGIHLRDGSSFNLVKNCKVYNVGIKKPGIGEGLYVGSDKNQHAGPGDENDNSKYDPDCNNNTIEGCIVGPNVTAEGVDVKEGTKNTIIRDCVFSAEGISGENSADAFIDLKGAYGFVYNNTFNLDGSTIVNAGIDFLDRGTNYNTGFRNAIFNNTFNLESRGDEIPTARKKQGDPSEIHVWDNVRNPNTPDFPISDGSLNHITQSCPSWNIESCDGTQNQAPVVSFVNPTTNLTVLLGYDALTVEVNATDPDGSISDVKLYIDNALIRQINQPPYQWGTGENANELIGLSLGIYTIKAEATDNEGKISDVEFTVTVRDENTGGDGDCSFGTPIATGLPTFDNASFDHAHVLGQGPDVSNISRLRISWNLEENKLDRFDMNTSDGVPEFYMNLKDVVSYEFNTLQPELTISNSNLPGWDGSYWVTKDGDNFVMVSKSNGFTIYFNNAAESPECESTLSNPDFSERELQVTIYPNPVNQKYLHIVAVSKEEKTVEVIDLLGKRIISQKLDANDPKVDVSHLHQGTYILLIKSDNNKESLFFVKK
ncbi:T9SS type A sorting domain-containing protein [uncultured Aquimarina sp.]|uniref:T9SS type A sorting domain-containing protein n=1 Tax=uncultured Aquimarina sp. TaxID=575652 RepID=UPI00263365DF|nr:T9SS type A sorting domain-containing protein [uncultured Aquimarina sp.]